MITTITEPSQNQKMLLNAFVNNVNDFAQNVSNLRDEKLIAFLDLLDFVSAENYSNNLLDMLHTARLDQHITVKQVQWWQRELAARGRK